MMLVCSFEGIDHANMKLVKPNDPYFMMASATLNVVNKKRGGRTTTSRVYHYNYKSFSLR